jgi:hypothetical protein
MFRACMRIHTAVHTTIGSVAVLFGPRALYVVAALGDLVTVTKTSHNIQNTRPERYSHLTNGCVNSCLNSPEDGPVGPKHVEIRQYINKI